MKYLPPNNDDNSQFKRFLKKCLSEQEGHEEFPLLAIPSASGAHRATDGPAEVIPGIPGDELQPDEKKPDDHNPDGEIICPPGSPCWEEYCDEMEFGCSVDCSQDPCVVTPLEPIWRWCQSPDGSCNCADGDSGLPVFGCWVPYGEEDDYFPIVWIDGLPYVWRCIVGIGCFLTLLTMVCEPPGSDNCFLTITGDIGMNQFPCDDPGVGSCSVDGFVTVYYQFVCSGPAGNQVCHVYWTTDPVNGPWIPLYDNAPPLPGWGWGWRPGNEPTFHPYLTPGGGIGFGLTIPLGYDAKWIQENWDFYIANIWGPFAQWFYENFGFWPPYPLWPDGGTGNDDWVPPYDVPCPPECGSGP